MSFLSLFLHPFHECGIVRIGCNCTAFCNAVICIINGKDISTMDIEYAPNVTKEYNADICSDLGITVPDD